MHTIDVPKWNETVANLTLMALGSSAPEILLSVIQTLQDMDALPPVLGPATIVGSAAFNLLVIVGVSILAVDETPKIVKDLGVFAVTSIFSLWAYIWLVLVLSVISPEKVTLAEAVVTLVFFVLLIVIAFAADKINEYVEDTRKS
jgi:solute carrier family 8 (sodium/calcium exchanger)